MKLKAHILLFHSFILDSILIGEFICTFHLQPELGLEMTTLAIILLLTPQRENSRKSALKVNIWRSLKPFSSKGLLLHMVTSFGSLEMCNTISSQSHKIRKRTTDSP